MPRALSASAALRVRGDLADVGGGREVHDRVAALGGGAHRGGVEEVAPDGLVVVVPRVGRRPGVEDARLVARGGQPVDDVGADEPGAPCYEDPHAASGR